MTVDTVVKIVESEKCGLDMSSYEDLHSSADVGGGTINGNDHVNGDAKDDYVFVNGSDVVSSNDHAEIHENDEVNVNVDGDGEGESDRLKNGVNVGEEESKVENEVNVGEEKREESKVENEVNVGVVVDGSGCDGKVDGEVSISSGVSEVNEDSVHESVVDEVKESNDLKPVIDEVKEGELVFESGDNGNASVDSIDSRSFDVDDNGKSSVYDGQEVAEVEVEDSVVGNGVADVLEPSEVEAGIDNAVVEVTEGEIEEGRSIVLPPEDGVEIQGSEPETLKDQIETPYVTENSGDVHVVEVPVTELESGDILESESKSRPLETDVTGRSVENDLSEAQPFDGDVEEEGLLLDDATPEEHSSDCQQQNLAPADGENEKRDLIEADPKIEQQGEESRESVVSEAAVCELDQGVIVDHNGSNSAAEPEETTDFESLTIQSEGAQNEGNQEFVAPELENRVSIIARESHDGEIMSTDDVKENGRASTADTQIDTADESALQDEPERVDGDRESEVMGETGESVEASPEEGVLHDQVAEQTVSFDVVDEKVPSEDRSIGKSLTSEDTSNLSELQSVEQTRSFDVIDNKLSSEICSSENNLASEDTPNLSELQSAEQTGSFDVVDENISSEDCSSEKNLTNLSELQSAEQTGSFDVVDEKISSEDCNSEKNLIPEDTTNLSELQSAEQTGSFDVVDEKISSEDCSSVKDSASEDTTNLSELQSAEQTGSFDVVEEKISSEDCSSDKHFASEDKTNLSELQSVEQTRSFDVVDKKHSSEDCSSVKDFASEDTTNLSELQSVEHAGSFNVVDEKISSEDCSSDKHLTSEDTTNLSELQSADNTAVNADQNDEGGRHSKDDVSESKVVPASDASSEDAGIDLRSDDNYLRIDTVEDVPAPTAPDNLNEREVVSDVSSAADNSHSGSADDTSCQTKLENNNDSIPCPNDTNSETKTVKSEIEVANKTDNVSDETLKPKISFGSFGGDVLSKSTPISTANGNASLKSSVNGDHSDGLIHDTACAKAAQPVEQIDDVSASSAEGSEIESSDVQNINPDLVRRPFCWLVKVPRFDEGKYKDQLRQGEIELAEKTKMRDAFQAEFSKQQAYCRELKSNRDVANSEVKAVRDLVWAKSREIDSAHSLINLARHAVTVEDIDNKIHNLENTLQHQTLNNLREEKELVREIKQLNLQRQKLLSNPQRQQEVQQALNQRGQTEEQLKVLKKELDALRENLAKADERFRAAKKKHDDESILLNDLKQQLKSADDIRQEAYAHLKTIQKQLNEKNAPFYKAKNDLRVAYNYATAGKKDSLERHCVNQVEKVMEMWNKNDEFRKEYIQCNMRRTVWKFGTLDGTRLGINEVPPSFGNVSDNRVKTPTKVDSATARATMERDLPVEAKTTDDKSSKKVEQKKAPPVKPVEAISKNSSAKAPVIIEIEEVKEEPKLTKEEEELARKAEQLRKEEEAVRLREQRRLEEKAKAEEALERKRRNALKAQARAEFKARKEAEEKEKERERRAKKKGKKKGIISENTENEPAQPSEPISKSVKEPEIADKAARTTKKPQKVSLHSKPIKTTKPIPPALRSKGKRGLLRYWPYACIVLLAIALFYLGSYERIQTIKQFISALLH
ncbi:hypothetical protein RND81_08G138900 [Saponaria officinalis]|uniref:Uncharacterized protein n=1 Tax=Saponaria officinalis TaxID=3572 RepID=A0AAW1J698_SAPOF